MATGAIAIGVLVAQELGVPFIYVRPEPKSHGRKNQIEGHLESGQNVVVIEDLISTGKSSLNAVKALKDAAGWGGLLPLALLARCFRSRCLSERLRACKLLAACVSPRLGAAVWEGESL